MNVFFKKYYFVLFFSLIISCSSFKSERVSVDTGDELASNITDSWVLKDTELAIIDISKQIDNHGGLNETIISFSKKHKKPKIFVGEVQNQTAEAYFPIDDLNDELLQKLSESGRYTLIDENARVTILKEIKYQNDGMVDSAETKKIGKQSGADWLIMGSVRMKPETLKGKTIKEYTVNIRITDIQNGEEVFRGRYKTTKYSVRRSSGW
jgi:PBP1b-binding outer membrane lipoprotein LpoB